jgi:hypothetical protein
MHHSNPFIRFTNALVIQNSRGVKRHLDANEFNQVVIHHSNVMDRISHLIANSDAKEMLRPFASNVAVQTCSNLFIFYVS